MVTASELLTQHRETLERFTAELLQPYLDRAVETRPRVRAKELNDPIWGTLQLSAAEVVLLDSPLLQRLRRIRQLGVVHLVYPAAVHTRFEHSLGITHQIERLVASINLHSSPGGSSGSEIPVEYLRVLRVAALCHDIGHGVMSHVSENALANDRLSEQLRDDFSAYYSVSGRKQLSEIAAYLIVGSPSFLELLALADDLAPSQLLELDSTAPPGQRLNRIQAAMQRLIISAPISDKFPLLHELLSGPFDADKLDYMPRDAATCGVPVVTDVPRLIQKVRSVNVGHGKLPAPIRRAIAVEQTHYTVTGIAWSGARTLDELALGRALMFDKIYRHHKVRAAEAMVASLISQVLSLRSASAAHLPLELGDEELLSLSIETILRLCGLIELTPEEEVRAHVAIDLAERLSSRRLLARAFAFSAKMYGDAYRDDPTQRAGILALASTCREPVSRLALVESIVSEVSIIARILGVPDPASCIPGDDLTPYIWIDPPKVSSESHDPDDTGHAYLIGPSGELRRSEEDYAETLGWSEAYVSTRDLGLVFCPQEVAPLVFLAAETVTRMTFKVRVPRTMWPYAKVEESVVETYRLRLGEAGYYADLPSDLRPTLEFLKRPDTASRVEEVVDRLHDYQGPIARDPASGKARPNHLRAERVRDWLRQFENESECSAALEMLEAIKIVNRAEANQALSDYLERNPQFQGGHLTVLGDGRDSGSVVTYFVGDVSGHYGCQVSSLQTALSDDLPMVFVDDYIGRGSQAMAIFAGWLGVPPPDDLNEVRVDELPENQKLALTEKQIGICFVAGTADGESALSAWLTEQGLSATVSRQWSQDQLPYATDAAIFSSPEGSAAMLRRCESVAKQLLFEPAIGHDENWVEARKLGYGNQGLLLISAYNTPTATVTALWHAQRPDIDWRPLFPRRPKR